MVFILNCLPIQKINPTAACRVIIAPDRPTTPGMEGGGTFFGSQTVDRLFHPSIGRPGPQNEWDGPGFEFSSLHGKSNDDDDDDTMRALSGWIACNPSILDNDATRID